MPPATPPAAAQLSGKYLTVVIAGEFYGIAVQSVREIIRLQRITPVPQLPAHVRGVINLRGRVIPIIDLRMKFGLPAPSDDRTCVVVVQVNAADGAPSSMGLIVDTVDEVATITDAEIEPIPEFGCRIDRSCLLGMAKIKGQVKTLLSIEQVVASGHD